MRGPFLEALFAKAIMLQAWPFDGIIKVIKSLLNPRIGLTTVDISTRLVAARRRKSNYSLPLSPRLAHFSLPIFVTLPVSYRARCPLPVSHYVLCVVVLQPRYFSSLFSAF